MQALYIRQYIYTIGNFVIILFQAISLSKMWFEYNVNTEMHLYYKVDLDIRVKK